MGLWKPEADTNKVKSVGKSGKTRTESISFEFSNEKVIGDFGKNSLSEVVGLKTRLQRERKGTGTGRG